LPFGDAEFDAVVCQFGVMFFPDQAHAFAEARRVLAPGGALLFSVWDRIEENELADTVVDALAAFFPDDPPRFLARTPHGHYHRAPLEEALRAGGFGSPVQFETVAARSKAAAPRLPAIAYCQGTPMRSEIEARAPARLGDATDAAAAAIERRFGSGAIDAKIQAHVLSVER
jgi:SAM-dependent methyltransferase